MIKFIFNIRKNIFNKYFINKIIKDKPIYINDVLKYIYYNCFDYKWVGICPTFNLLCNKINKTPHSTISYTKYIIDFNYNNAKKFNCFRYYSTYFEPIINFWWIEYDWTDRIKFIKWLISRNKTNPKIINE